MQRRVIDANGSSFEVLDEGSGNRNLLVLHGFCGSKEDFAEVIGGLSDDGWHVVVPDQRGHGASAHPPGEAAYGFESFVDDAEAMTEALGWRRFALLGHSMGGMIAQRLALRHAGSQSLRALILMDTFDRGLELDRSWVEAARQVVRQGGLPALLEGMRGLEDPMTTPAHKRLLAERPGYQDELDAKLLACSPDMWLAMTVELFEAADVLDELRSLTVPALVLVGEQDKASFEPSIRMSEAIVGAELAVISDAGHSPQLEAPPDWLDAVRGFLSAAWPPSSA